MSDLDTVPLFIEKTMVITFIVMGIIASNLTEVMSLPLKYDIGLA